MAVTVSELEGMVNGVPGWHPIPAPAGKNTIGLLFPTKEYVNPTNNERKVVIILALEEDGEYLKVVAPMAFKAGGEHFWETLKACLQIQWATKLVQFEYDEKDGEIRPIVEWPIEDGTVTPTQLYRAIKGLVGLIDASYPVLERAARTGEVDTSGMFT
jgi:hypothetical protein